MIETMANANALFQGLKAQTSFTGVITIRGDDEEAKVLRDARKKIRRALREQFRTFGSFLHDSRFRLKLVANRDLRLLDEAKAIVTVDVRFLTQGSYAYETLIRPAQPKHQEIDLDDGVYVPVPFRGGSPIFSSDGLFAVIEDALGPLIKAEGWTFERKDTCIRVCLTGHNAHVDLPLFAVEDKAFRKLTHLFESRMGGQIKSNQNLNKAFDQQRDIRLSQAQILLADRDLDWRPSDPKAIHDWFEDQVRRFGPVLRRLCRYFKAWRDEIWSKGGPSSLSLMIACVDGLAALEEQPTDVRDDLLVALVSAKMVARFKRGDLRWNATKPALDEHWSADERNEYASALTGMAEESSKALFDTFHRKLVVERFQNSFGKRFPDAPESVLVSKDSQSAAIITSKAETVPMPRVGTSVSG